jgi:hypothetical protein
MKMAPTQDKRSVPLSVRRGILLKIGNVNSISPHQKGPPQGKLVYVLCAQFETKGFQSPQLPDMHSLADNSPRRNAL